MASPSVSISELPAGARVLLLGRFARGRRAALEQSVRERGLVLERQITSATALVIVGAAGWPLRRNGRLPRDLLIAQALHTQSGRPEILGEQEPDSSTQSFSASRAGGLMRRRLHPIDPNVGNTPRCLSFRAASRQRDLVRLIDAGIPLMRLRRALGQLARWFPEAVAEADRLLHLHPSGVALRDAHGRWKTPSGQRLFPFTLWPLDSSSRFQSDQLSSSPNLEMDMVFPLRPPDLTGSPQPPADLFTTAVAQERAGQFQQAEFTYRTLLKTEGPDADACFNLANVLAAGRRFESAVERLSIAVELRPRFVEAWYNLGLLAQHTGQHRLARASLQAALDLAPTFEAAREALAGTCSAT